MIEKGLEKKHKKVVAELDKILVKKQQNNLEPAKTKETKKRRQRDTEKPERKFSMTQPNIRSNVIGSVLMIAGLTLIIIPDPPNITLNFTSILNRLLMNPNSLNIKIGFALVLIGLFLIWLIYEKKPSQDTTYTERKLDSKKKRLLMSEKITMVLSIWMLLLIFITYTASLEILFILLFIGTLVTKELTDEFTAPNLKKRLNIFIIIFLIAFIAIISQKIINIF